MKWLCLENWETLWSGIQGPRCHTEKLESFLVFIHIAQCLITLALSWRLKLSLIPRIIPHTHHIQAHARPLTLLSK